MRFFYEKKKYKIENDGINRKARVATLAFLLFCLGYESSVTKRLIRAKPSSISASDKE